METEEKTTTSGTAARARTVVVLRHGPDTHENGNPPLTPMGLRMAIAAADNVRRLAAPNTRFRILCSPLLRTVETAEALATALSTTATAIPWLDQHASKRTINAAVIEVLSDLGYDTTLVLVTHQPQVRLLAGSVPAGHCVAYTFEVEL